MKKNIFILCLPLVLLGCQSEHDSQCETERDSFVDSFVARGVSETEAEKVWYSNQIQIQFADLDCSEYAKREMDK